jgi:hypothetical protein
VWPSGEGCSCPRRRTGLALCLTGVIVAGCSSDKSTPRAHSSPEANKPGLAVATDAAAALEKAGAVRLSGFLGEPATGKPHGVNMQMQSDGSTGTFTVGASVVSLIRAGGVTYVKGPAGYFASQGITAANAAKLANRWLRLPADSSLTTAFRFTDLITSFTSPSAGVTVNAKVTSTKLNGKPVLVVTESDGAQLDVAATAPPYPLRLVSAPKSGRAVATLSGFGNHVGITAPKGAVDATKLVPQ